MKQFNPLSQSFQSFYLNMGATDTGHIAIHSSIALLQERFKQLHREKRRREERELLRLFSDAPVDFGANQSTRHYIDRVSKRRRLFHARSLHTDELAQPLKVSLSLWPSSSSECQTNLRDTAKAHAETKMQTEDTLTLCEPSCFLASLETDVDTSLHL